jgi:hypothetical protein
MDRGAACLICRKPGEWACSAHEHKVIGPNDRWEKIAPRMKPPDLSWQKDYHIRELWAESVVPATYPH